MAHKRLGKKTRRTIQELSILANDLWREAFRDKACLEEGLKKSRLVRVVADHLERQGRGTLQSSLPYIAAGNFLLRSAGLPYETLHKNVCDLLLFPNGRPSDLYGGISVPK